MPIGTAVLPIGMVVLSPIGSAGVAREGCLQRGCWGRGGWVAAVIMQPTYCLSTAAQLLGSIPEQWNSTRVGAGPAAFLGLRWRGRGMR